MPCVVLGQQKQYVCNVSFCNISYAGENKDIIFITFPEPGATAYNAFVAVCIAGAKTYNYSGSFTEEKGNYVYNVSGAGNQKSTAAFTAFLVPGTNNGL